MHYPPLAIPFDDRKRKRIACHTLRRLQNKTGCLPQPLTTVNVVKKNLDCREICAVAVMVEYQQAAESMQWSLAKGSGLLFPSVLEGGEKGGVALTAVQMTTSLQAHLRAAGMEYKRYTMHSFRVGGAASHNMDGTAIDVIMEYVGWKSAAVARRYVGVTASAAAAGVKRSRETAFIEADALPWSEQFARSYTAFRGAN